MSSDAPKSSEATTSTEESLGRRLFTGFSCYNWINVLAFIVNIVITYGFGTAGWANQPDNGELSTKYQTFLTPDSKAFLIWSLIFVMQGLWAVWQLVVPSQRKHPIVTDVMQYKYVIITLWQCCWTFAFTWEIIWLSLIFMLLLSASLIWTVLALNATRKCFYSWIIWQFPFALHCGWILAATALNVNVTLVAYGASTASQLAIAIVSLVVLFIVAVLCLLPFPCDLTPPCVIVWALGWIYYELQNPIASITEQFTEKQINGFALGAIDAVGVLLGLILTKVLYVLLVQRKNRCETTSGGCTNRSNEPAATTAAEDNV